MVKHQILIGRDTESLLADILGSEKRAAEIAEKYSLQELAAVTQTQLSMRDKMYARLVAAIELGRRVGEAKANYRTIAKICGSSDAIEFCRKQFSRLITDGLQEEFHIVTLDTKNQVLHPHLITIGTLDASLVHPREVFRPAIQDSASSIIAVHNHPSGDPTPSREDISVDQRLVESGKTLGIDVLDSIIVARDGCVSLRESR